ncbi:glycerol-3-phosphate responsive antiterminator [Carboxydochorda subterranea]|uniref:Glycerol-3-phosphate responsive antiterminator n=1 Tax=Carboxydichorda subterranea TaxID=3109565 RepID=A0ABZ1BXD0_9FIRM|nr:glycerol-3-phosphate responsive antiterminator [Limnochorda sp. L945t]WRP17331.1 glycerol-3-phosphate responsive antiterminator [Limnochorda sp. L945t]
MNDLPTPTSWLDEVRQRRVIAAVRRPDDLRAVQRARLPVVFVLNCTIFDLREMARVCRETRIRCFAHLDLVEGVGKDAAGVEFLGREVGVDGIVTTRSASIRDARRVGLVAVQRVFLLDSGSLGTALSVVRSTRPDAVEIMPALVVPAIVHRLPFADLPPVIAGGLVQTLEELHTVLATPVVAVSTSAHGLWAYRPGPPVSRP